MGDIIAERMGQMDFKEKKIPYMAIMNPNMSIEEEEEELAGFPPFEIPGYKPPEYKEEEEFLFEDFEEEEFIFEDFVEEEEEEEYDEEEDYDEFKPFVVNEDEDTIMDEKKEEEESELLHAKGGDIPLQRNDPTKTGSELMTDMFSYLETMESEVASLKEKEEAESKLHALLSSLTSGYEDTLEASLNENEIAGFQNWNNIRRIAILWAAIIVCFYILPYIGDGVCKENGDLMRNVQERDWRNSMGKREPSLWWISVQPSHESGTSIGHMFTVFISTSQQPTMIPKKHARFFAEANGEEESVVNVCLKVEFA